MIDYSRTPNLYEAVEITDILRTLIDEHGLVDGLKIFNSQVSEAFFLVTHIQNLFNQTKAGDA